MKAAETRTASMPDRSGTAFVNTAFFNKEGRQNFFNTDSAPNSFFFNKSNGYSTIQPQLTIDHPNVQYGQEEKLPQVHELTHVVKQRSSIPMLQKSPQDTDPVESCLKQAGGDLLPGGVGLVEQINRDVLLNDALGIERSAVEAQIRKDPDARRFVCEAGVSAVLALYYNRDFRKRLDVKLARRSLSAHPEYYSFSGFDTATLTKKNLEKKYGIFIERGNKDWSPRDIVLLTQALGKLTEDEIPLIRNYHFIRWTNRCYQLLEQNPNYSCDLNDYSICGLHETDVISRKYTITMYDCMGGGPDDEINPDYNVEPGAETIIHEIGHAMEFGRVRLALEKETDAKKKYERIKSQLDAAKTTGEKEVLKKSLEAAKKEKEDAEKKLNDALTTTTLDKFKKLTKGKKPLTPYSMKNEAEAFAEAFMLFKVAPKKLRKLNKRLYVWFSKGGFI